MILIVSDRNRFRKLLDSNKWSVEYKAQQHQVMAIYLVPQEPRYLIWLVQ